MVTEYTMGTTMNSLQADSVLGPESKLPGPWPIALTVGEQGLWKEPNLIPNWAMNKLEAAGGKGQGQLKLPLPHWCVKLQTPEGTRGD